MASAVLVLRAIVRVRVCLMDTVTVAGNTMVVIIKFEISVIRCIRAWTVDGAKISYLTCVPRPPTTSNDGIRILQFLDFSLYSLKVSGLLSNTCRSLYREASYCPPRPEVKEHSGEEERDLLHRRPGSSRTPRLSHRHHRHRSKPQSRNQKVGAAARTQSVNSFFFSPLLSEALNIVFIVFCMVLSSGNCRLLARPVLYYDTSIPLG